LALENLKNSKSKVYFIGVNKTDDARSIKSKLKHLLDKSNLLDFIRKDYRVAVKMHFGEEGNTGYVRPEYVGIICDSVSKKQALPFLSDTNTLYRGRRMDSDAHLKLAYEHGFIPQATGAAVIIPDDTKKENTREVDVGGRFIKKAKIAGVFQDADAIIGVAHFKGHIMTGFGGALKNIGMGCATREGKLAQHSEVSPFVNNKKCTGCALCLNNCPRGAILIKNKKAFIESAKCIGCATCIAVCAKNAVDLDWEAGGNNIQEKMAEYAKAALKNKAGRAVFINFALKITKECDCIAKDDPAIAPDVGIFISQDPVSIDKASMDLVNEACGRDIFKQAHPGRDGLKQLLHASGIGLGNMDYELIKTAIT
jgi:uncharacterized Fe-S center protein